MVMGGEPHGGAHRVARVVVDVDGGARRRGEEGARVLGREAVGDREGEREVLLRPEDDDAAVVRDSRVPEGRRRGPGQRLGKLGEPGAVRAGGVDAVPRAADPGAEVGSRDREVGSPEREAGSCERDVGSWVFREPRRGTLDRIGGDLDRPFSERHHLDRAPEFCRESAERGAVRIGAQVHERGDHVPSAGRGAAGGIAVVRARRRALSQPRGVQLADRIQHGPPGREFVVDEDHGLGAGEPPGVAGDERVAGRVRVLLLEPPEWPHGRGDPRRVHVVRAEVLGNEVPQAGRSLGVPERCEVLAGREPVRRKRQDFRQ
ncbi:hypothetical protein SCMU_37010 [Sinomonas cyclohexanicum]|uniref:Uncharacterized protein n=1 Tax=Sinomonas cyclohexanicum TaxID=322009 RepID=A0ABN6FN70_SINCY|nr:hypothetical protein SCMU_37010 [Corynebacterium cyclohexanicum]